MRKRLRSFLKLETLLLLTAFFSSVVWAALMPIWHFPDEQAHFAQVQNTSELGRDPRGSADLSQEIAESERVLGTLRDERGNNQFTGNPSFRISYVSGIDGSREQQLKSLPVEARKVFVGRESPHYPPLFYWYSSAWYRLVYGADLFTRVLLVRIGSAVLFTGIIYLAYKTGKELFPKHSSHALGLATVTASHPMLVFVSSGINNDTLVTVIGSAITLACLRLIRHGYSIQRMFAIALLFGLGMLTKQTIFLLTPLMIAACLIAYFRHRGSVKKIFAALLVSSASLGLVFALMKLFNQGFWLPYWPLSLSDMFANPDLLTSLQVLVSRLYRETLPWYWGVFKWLGVVFPLPLIRAFKLLTVISVVGWVVYAAKVMRKQVDGDNPLLWLALALGNAGYGIGLVAWELSAILKLGFGHGIQGRYFFPLIVSQMALLYFGWLQLVPKSWHAQFNAMLRLGLVGLGVYSLWYITSQYYSFESFSVFVQQVSQYKASIAKWPMLGIWITAWFGMLLTFIIKTITRKH